MLLFVHYYANTWFQVLHYPLFSCTYHPSRRSVVHPDLMGISIQNPTKDRCDSIMLVLRTVFNILVKSASPRGSISFKCLMFSLSGSCELLVLLLFYCLFDLRRGECDVVSLYVLGCSVNESVCFVCCVFDNVCELFCETIRNMFWCVYNLLLNVMELLSVVGCALLDTPCMVFQRMCVLCMWSLWASRCSFHVFCLCFACRKLSPHLGVCVFRLCTKK